MTTERATNWSVTINMLNVQQARVDEQIQMARQKGWIVNGQLEQGSEGTPHYQLHVKTPQTRFSTIKRMFPTAHIEVARNVAALATYVAKAETRIGNLPEPDEKYITATKLWDTIYQLYDTGDKDGWFDDGDETEEVFFYHDSANSKLHRDPLKWFDAQISILIRKGYFVDPLATNPAIRSFFKKFYTDILFRSRNNIREALDRQTDRQELLISQEVNIPTTNEDDPQQVSEEHLEEEEEDDETASVYSESSEDESLADTSSESGSVSTDEGDSGN